MLAALLEIRCVMCGLPPGINCVIPRQNKDVCKVRGLIRKRRKRLRSTASLSWAYFLLVRFKLETAPVCFLHQGVRQVNLEARELQRLLQVVQGMQEVLEDRELFRKNGRRQVRSVSRARAPVLSAQEGQRRRGCLPLGRKPLAFQFDEFQ